jgi:hypothetical protein
LRHGFSGVRRESTVKLYPEQFLRIQKNRGNLEEIFYRELGRSFADFGSDIGQSGHTAYTAADSMTLVSKDDMDIQTARQKKLREKDIPGGPSSLDSAYHQAASSLLIEHQARLILYMLFNKFVMGTTDQLYYEYNKHLLKAGLLPNLKYEVRIDPSKAKAAEGEKAVFPANKSGRANSNRKGNNDSNADVNSKTDSNNTGSGNGNNGTTTGHDFQPHPANRAGFHTASAAAKHKHGRKYHETGRRGQGKQATGRKPDLEPVD